MEGIGSEPISNHSRPPASRPLAADVQGVMIKERPCCRAARWGRLARSTALAALISVAGRSLAAGQAAPGTPRSPTPTRGELRGRVVNAADQTPIGGATIVVANPGATAPATRTSTNADGLFAVTGLRPGRYRVRILAIGYTTRELPIEIGASPPGVDLGTVTLTAVPVELQSLVVTGKTPDVQLAPDRTTYAVRDMPTTRGGTVLDALRTVPAVDVDLDNIISLRGNSGVIVQINGRPSPMKPAQLGNFLAQMPAANVDKIEVIPNPSAREDPTGVAGIINIVLKQRADAGTSGGFTVGGGTRGSATIGANLGYQRGPLTLYGSYGFLRDRRTRSESLYRENRFLHPITLLEETGTRIQLPLAHTVTGSAGYQLGEHDELALDGIYSTRGEEQTYGLQYRDLDAGRTPTGLSDRTSSGKGHESNLEGTLGYRHTFAKGHKLSSELRFVRDEEGGPNRVVGRTLALDGTTVDTTALENQTTVERPHEFSLKADYVRPLSKGLRLSAGYRRSVELFHTTLVTDVFDPVRGGYRPDSSRISDFTFRQAVNAGYLILDARRGKFQLEGGVRVERATTHFRLQTTGASFNNPYTSAFPSGLIVYNIDDGHQVKLSYSTRIRRPDDTDQLDPTPRIADPLNVFRGNPYLKPEYIRALELGLQRTSGRTTVQVTPFFRHTLDAVRTIRTIDNAGVTTRTFANVATSDAFGTDLTVALTGGRLSGLAGGSAFRQISDAANIGPGLNARTFGWTVRTNVAFRVSNAFDLQALVSYRGPTTVEQGRNASQTRVSLAARQKLMNDRLSLTLRVIDPFNTSIERSTTVDPRFYQVSDRRRAIRGLLLNVNWTLGKPKEEDESIDLSPP